MGAQVGSTGGLKRDINVTPLVDVVLVLLIIFMVVTPVLQQGKEVELPVGRGLQGDQPMRDAVVVSITRDGRVWVGDQTYAVSELAKQLGREFSTSSTWRVLLKGDRALTVGDVRPVVDAVRAAGAREVALALREKGK